MAIVLSTPDGVTHLRSHREDVALCGIHILDTHVTENMLTCEHCAKAALEAISTTTKKERKEWRDLL